MATINTHLSIITLNLSNYNSSMKRHRLTEWINLFVICKKYSLALKIGTALEQADRQKYSNQWTPGSQEACRYHYLNIWQKKLQIKSNQKR